MKRKLINGVMLLTALTAVGTLSSCKDYDSEQLAQQQYNGSFSQKLDELDGILDALSKKHDAYEVATNERLDKLEAEIKEKLTAADLNGLVTDQDLQDAIDALRQELLAKIPEGGGSGSGCTCDDAHIQDIVRKLFKDEMTPEIKKWISDAIGTAITDIATLTSRLNQLDVTVLDIKSDIFKLNKRIDELIASGMTREEVLALINEQQIVFDAKILALQTEINSLRYTINSFKTQLGQTNSRLDALAESLNSVYNQLGEFNSRLLDTDRKAVEALTLAESNKRVIDNILDNMVISDAIVENLQGDVTELKQEYAALKRQYQELGEKLTDAIADVYSKLDGYYTKDQVDQLLNDNISILQKELSEALESKADNEEFQKLVGFVNNLSSEFAALQGQVNKLLGIQDRLNSLITSVLVQGVYNPLFGSFSLPIGVQSNMLLGYYGVYNGGKALEFPTASQARTYNNEPALTQDEYDAISMCYNFSNAEKIENGDIIASGNMGKVFMTLNPNNVDVSGANLTLERSNGTASTARLTSVRKSNEELTFGYTTRADNGFYEADVEYDKTYTAVAPMKFEVTPGLTTAIKDAIKNHTKSDIYQLLRKVYDQLNINLPAYALKAGWNVDGKDYATFSKYEIATVLFTPLSYSTLYGQSIDKKLPTHSPIDDVLLNINKEKYHFDFKFEASDINAHFEFKQINFDYDTDDWYAEVGGLTLELSNGDKITFAEGEKIPMNPEAIEKFVTEMQNKINEATGQFDEDMDSEFKRVLNELRDEIYDNLKDINKEINDKIDSIIDDIQDKVNGKAGKLIDFVNKFLNLYNKAADRINGWLEDPNHLLQPTLIYESNGNLHRLSSDFNHPTTFTMAGGDGVELFATSNTAEIFAPAYKKFIAIAGDWNEDGTRQTSTYRGLNYGDHMAKVLPGDQVRVGLSTGAMKKGHKYEILYTAVDYRGYISTQRFYIVIK